MKEILVVDIETTGFLKQGGLIVEIGIVSLDLDTGGISVLFDSVVKEGGFGRQHAQSPFGWIFQNSNLTYEDVVASENLKCHMYQLQTIFDNHPLGATAFNKQFDFGFLKARGLHFRELPCIMLEACPVVNLPPNRGRSTPKWPKVEEAWEYLFPNNDYVEQHRAIDDVEHEAMILHELYMLGRYTI